MRNIKISIVIPVYNRPEKLERLLGSIQKQTFKDYEIVIVDDGSIDDMSLVVKKFPNEPIKYIKITNSGGPARPRNYGILNSLGTWIAFCDSDDWWYPEKLEKVDQMTNQYDFIYHKLQVFNEINGEFGGLIGTKFQKKPFKHLLTIGNPIPMSSVVVNKNIINGVLFDEERNLSAIEDYELWIRIFKKNIKFVFVDKVLGGYSVDNDNISSISNKSVYRQDALRLKVSSYLEDKKQIAEFKQYSQYQMATIEMLLNNNKSAIKHYSHALGFALPVTSVKALIRIINIWIKL